MYSRLKAAFHLYVPAGMVDVARRLSDDNNVHVAEIWSYHIVGDQPRFTLVHRSREASIPKPRPAVPPPVRAAAVHSKPAAKPASKAVKPAKASTAKKPVKPAKTSSNGARASKAAKAVKGAKKKKR